MNLKNNSLEYVLYQDMGCDQGKLKHLFEHAFPLEERPPFKFHIALHRQKIYGVYHKKNFVGLVNLVFYQDIIYLYFLAIKKKYRQRGFGSQILEDLFAKYDQDYRIYLIMEEVDESYPNYKERIARATFYIKRGFNISDIKISEFDVTYSLLNNHKVVNFIDHLNIFKYLLEENGFYPTYEQNTYEVK